VEHVALPNNGTIPAAPRTFAEFTRYLYQSKGIRGFYAGAFPAVIQIIPYMGMNFAIYDLLTSKERSVGLSAYAGSISGAVSKIMVYPMDTVKRRLQAEAFFGDKQ
jgi:solute carrier family 25 thiamine pyrophosphate transporter 19